MEQTRKLAAVMFTDIVGYTAIMSKDEKKALQVLQKNRDILKPLIRQFNGTWIKELGDGTISIFQSTNDAVNCAVEIQRSLKEETDFKLRIGIHIGDVIFSEGDIFGDGVNVASRIEPLAEPGGICVSYRVYDDIINQPEIEAVFLGEKELKNISRPIKVYAITVKGQPAKKIIKEEPSAEILPTEAQAPAVQATVAIAIKRPKALVGANVRSPLRYVLSALVIIILTVTGYFVQRKGEPPVPSFANLKQITTDKGWEGYPTWSPDGGRLAYESWQGGKFDICIIQSGGGRSLNLTADQPGNNYRPSWSPDGSLIAFVSSRDSSATGMGYYVIPALGGPARKVADAPQSLVSVLTDPPCWSADGTELACLVIDSTGPFAEIVPIKGGTSRRVKLTQPPGSSSRTLSRKDLSWSPDGRYFAYTDGYGIVDPSQLWVMRAADGKGFPVTDRQFKNWNPSWSRDGRFLYFISNREGSMDLWRVHIGKDGIPLGEPRLVTTGLGLSNAAFSPDGKRLVCSKGGYKMNIWKVPIPKDRSSPAKWAEARQLTNEQVPIYFLDVSPDGKRLAFDSERDGILHVWVMPVEGGQMWRVTTDSTVEFNPRWSPDSREIAFISYRSGHKDIWVASSDGGMIRQVTMDSVSDDFPVWSPDGREIAFTSWRSGNGDIWIIPAQGGEARQITHDPENEYISDWSPDGHWLLFFSPFTADHARLYKVQVEGGEPELVTKIISRSAVWTPDGKKIYFANTGVAVTNVWEVPAEGGAERMLTDLEGRLGFIDFGLATDGKSVFFPPWEVTSDLWVMDVVNK